MAVTDKTRSLFRSLAARLREYRVPGQQIPPTFTLAGPAGGEAAPAAAAVPRTRGKHLTLSEALDRQTQGTLTAAELVTRCLGVIERLDPKLNAFVTVTRDAALARAAELDRQRAGGRPLGPLHGIPVAVKDLMDVDGLPTTASSRVRAGSPPARGDATVVARLKAAGAIVIGKTHTHEFALGVSTPQSRNPWDDRRLAGGSSGGSAIAIATGMALGSVNTDTRGSIRVPSALCGAVGLKATFGVVPKSGVITLSWTMDHVGPITRSVEDAARMLSVLAGADSADPFSLASRPTDYTAFLGRDVRGLKVGVPMQLLDGVDAEVTRSFDAAGMALRDRGVEVVQLAVPTPEELLLCSAAGLIVSRCEAAAYHQPTLGEPALYTPDVFAQLDEARNVLAVDYIQALRYRTQFLAAIDSVFGSVDLLAMPTIPVVAPLADEAEAVMVLLARNCIPWSFGWYPTLNLPSGLSPDRLPISLQLVGPRFSEGRLISVASAVEHAIGFEYPDF